MDRVDFSLVLPAYNEAEEIETVLIALIARIRNSPYTCEVVAVNNGSTDRTAEILERLSHQFLELTVVTVPINQGFGHGILEGLRVAKGNVLGWMPADGQLRPEDISTALDAFKRNSARVLKGVRVERHDSLPRLVQSFVYNLLFRILFGVRYRDINAPPKLFTREVYTMLQLSSKDWFLDAELIIKASQRSIPVEEVRMDGRDRITGSSKVRVGTVFEFVKNMILYYRNPF